MSFDGLGRLLLILGLVIAAVGLALVLLPKMPFIGKLPGDFFFEKGSFKFYFPLATSIILSLVLTVILNLVFRIFR